MFWTVLGDSHARLRRDL